MGKLISFPKNKAKKVLSLQKAEAKRLVLSMSMLSLAVVALVLGEHLNDQVRPTYIVAGSPDRLQEINRAIASAQPYDLVEDIQWENDLAQRLNRLERAPAAIGHAPNQLDELRFGPLAGKYRINEQQTRISQIDYVDSADVTDRPVFLRNRIGFLQDYHQLLWSILRKPNSMADEPRIRFNMRLTNCSIRMEKWSARPTFNWTKWVAFSRSKSRVTVDSDFALKLYWRLPIRHHGLSDGSRFSTVSPSADLRIASVQDRVLAVFFDLAILAPFASLILDHLYQMVELSYLAPGSNSEFLLLLFTAVVCTSGLWIGVMTAFWLWRGASPGMMIMKLRLQSTAASGEPLRWTQATLRACLWAGECFLLAVPFLEILGHPQRRGFHDRASETEVVTLKTQGDLGPHPYETRFIRHLILAFVGAGGLWVLLFTVRVYQSASRGDWTHAQMEMEDGLCPSISAHDVQDHGQSRVDFALALFLTGEAEESCLLHEADFALWSQDHSEQAWAYLAKAFYYHYDAKRSDEYRQLVCPTEASGPACELSQQIGDHLVSALPAKAKASWSGRVLQIREASAQGDYQHALQGIETLSQANVTFAPYAQKQRVKIFWALHEHEKALGAYLNVWPFLEPSDQAELAGWLCLEQTDENCNDQAYSACENVRETLQQHQQRNATMEAVLGVVAENECQHRHDPVLLGFQEIFEDNPHLGDLAMALSADSGWTKDKRLMILRQLSFESGVSKVVQRRAQLALLRKSTEPQDRAQVAKALEQSERHDWNWQKLQLAIGNPSKQEHRLPASEAHP